MFALFFEEEIQNKDENRPDEKKRSEHQDKQPQKNQNRGVEKRRGNARRPDAERTDKASLPQSKPGTQIEQKNEKSQKNRNDEKEIQTADNSEDRREHDYLRQESDNENENSVDGPDNVPGKPRNDERVHPLI